MHFSSSSPTSLFSATSNSTTSDIGRHRPQTHVTAVIIACFCHQTCFVQTIFRRMASWASVHWPGSRRTAGVRSTASHEHTLPPSQAHFSQMGLGRRLEQTKFQTLSSPFSYLPLPLFPSLLPSLPIFPSLPISPSPSLPPSQSEVHRSAGVGVCGTTDSV